MSEISITQASTDDDIAIAAELFREYEKAIGLDLCFQGFEDELNSLPGKYTPPDGCLLIARIDGEPAGCVAMRPIDAEHAEMKRLYVRSSFRGHGVGLYLVNELIDRVRDRGYIAIRLDTFPPKMEKAVEMYRRLRFKEIDAYYDNPFDDVLYMELILSR